jgi:2-hydroxychromene-2-carboxylate isomerase
MRGAIAAKIMNIFQEYSEAIFTGIWVKDLNLGDLSVLQEYLEKNEIDTKKLFDLVQSDEVKTILIQNTKEAVEQGVFGAPTFIIDNELIFGQDRLNFIKLALKL